MGTKPLRTLRGYRAYIIESGEKAPNPKILVLPKLVARIARPKSLAIWHRGRSHRRPNCSGSPNRRHFASLDLKIHPDFPHCRPTSQDFRRRFFLHFPVINLRASEYVFTSLAKKQFRIASDLGVCDSNRIAHRGCIARFGPLRVLLRKRPVLLRANVLLTKDRKRPHYRYFCGKIHREGSCSKAAGGP